MQRIAVIPAQAGIQDAPMRSIAVIPAKSGIQRRWNWITRCARPSRRPSGAFNALARFCPAFAGMTVLPALGAEPVAGVASTAGGVVEMLGSLMLVLVVIFALAWLARWLQGARLGRGLALQMQAGIQVGAKEKVVLLQVGEQQFLVGVAAGGVTLLHRFERPVKIESQVVELSPFAERLRQALGGKAAQ